MMNFADEKGLRGPEDFFATISDEALWNNSFYDFARKVIMTAIGGVIRCIGFLLTAQDSFRNILLSL